jgi:hypothetical protein
MPYEDTEGVIEGIHSLLYDNQALIEVNAKEIPNGKLIYTIVKSQREPGDYQYALSMDIFARSGVVHIHGYFDETEPFGERESAVYEALRQNGIISDSDGLYEWMADPYDKDCANALMMNMSELAKFDPLFPLHPLSIARSYVDEIALL